MSSPRSARASPQAEAARRDGVHPAGAAAPTGEMARSRQGVAPGLAAAGPRCGRNGGASSRARRLAAAAALLAAAVVRAGEPGAPAAEPAPPAVVPAVPGGDAAPEISVVGQFVLGSSVESVVAGGRGNGMASGVELLVRWRALLVGGFFDFTGADGTAATAYLDPQHPGYGGNEGTFLGVAAGVAHAPRPWARLQLLAQGGRHRVAIQSNFTLPDAEATLAFVGLKAGALALAGGLERFPQALGARRLGGLLQVDLRSDLGRATVHPTVPPEVVERPAVRVGGTSFAVTAGAVLEW